MLLDAHNLLELIKKAAKEAADAGQDSDFCYGTVTSASPLKIIVEQKMELTAAQLVLCRNVTNYTTTITVTVDGVDWLTEETSGGAGDASFAPHNHPVKGTKSVIINNALKKGEKVVLIRKKGGQEYLVLDRVVKE